MVRTIPLDAGRFLFRDDAGVWVLREAEGGVVRSLNSYEARFVQGAIEAATARALRDTIVAREALERQRLEWFDALGAVNAFPSWDAATRTRALAARDRLHAMRLGRLASQARLARLPSVANWDADNLGHARGLEHACAIMEGREPRHLTEPFVWGRDRRTLRGRYRIARAERMSVLGAATAALGGWIGGKL